MTRKWNKWTPEEDALLRELWASDVKMDVIASHFPNRQHFTVYEHARRVLGLPQRRIPQPFDDVLSWRLISAQLQKAPATAKALADATGLKHSTVAGLLKNRHGRLVFISGYVRHTTRCLPVRVWALGNGRDAHKPRALTATERKRRYMKKLRKKEPERIDAWAAKVRVRKQMKSGELVRRDPAAAWIGTTTHQTAP
ncbi:hypothetical protein ACUXAV_000363 [Cupriavidus metallidurans]|uniref:hypothetical protein n=1 Tax=Cupriavidus metallidurans TaxID=119219 RepID=UPI000493516B|nr:hypothetical protein [Cupriavidus metallidurans]MDE4918323.1 hypothetical protein [Cupriavidus metallidurans]